MIILETPTDWRVFSLIPERGFRCDFHCDYNVPIHFASKRKKKADENIAFREKEKGKTRPINIFRIIPYSAKIKVKYRNLGMMASGCGLKRVCERSIKGARNHTKRLLPILFSYFININIR